MTLKFSVHVIGGGWENGWPRGKWSVGLPRGVRRELDDFVKGRGGVDMD